MAQKLHVQMLLDQIESVENSQRNTENQKISKQLILEKGIMKRWHGVPHRTKKLAGKDFRALDPSS